MKSVNQNFARIISSLIIGVLFTPFLGFSDASFDKKTVAIVENIKKEIPNESLHNVKEDLRSSQALLSQRMVEISEQQKQIDLSLKKLAIAEQEQLIERVLKRKLDLMQELNFVCDDLLKNEQRYANLSQQITNAEKELLKSQQVQVRLIEEFSLLQENSRNNH